MGRSTVTDSDNMEKFRQGIIKDMSEGVLTIGFDGRIEFLNQAALDILDRREEELVGRSFGGCFFEFEENDGFNQAILDAVYDRNSTHRRIVPYYTGTVTRQLSITTSFLREGEEKIGIIAVLSDISELVELRDAVKAMEKIRKLNEKLELRNELLSETFGRFLSDEIVRQLLDTPDGLALGGKKESLTVMMSDLRGFTVISEQMEAQALVSMLNHYLGEMTEIIQKRNGTIIEFIGDGIMAIFGAPAPSEHHAADAVAAAVEMEAQMEKINQWNQERGYPRLEMGIGINTGDVIVGNIGSEKRTKYGVIGSHVNLCGRIESYTVGGQILIAPSTRQAILSPLQIEQEQEVFPKGVEKPVILSQVTGIGEPYGVSCEVESEEPEKLERPEPVLFYLIQSKHRDQEGKKGTLTALSRKEAVLSTDWELHPFDNLQFSLYGENGEEGKVFCKVLSGQEKGWRIHFTSLPPGFEAWYERMRKGRP